MEKICRFCKQKINENEKDIYKTEINGEECFIHGKCLEQFYNSNIFIYCERCEREVKDEKS